MKLGATLPLSLGTKVTAQSVAAVATAIVDEDVLTTEESTSSVVSVTGLDGTLNAPPVEDTEEAQSSATRVSIQGGNSVNNLMSDASVSDKRPEIIAKTPLFSFQDKEKIEGLLDSRRFERFLRLANANLVWEEIQNQDPSGLYTTLAEAQTVADELILNDVKALASLRSAIDSVSLALDIRHNSSTITEIAKEIAEEEAIDSDGAISDYPDSIEEFLAEACGFQESSVSNFSNTKIYHTLLRELYNSIDRHYPTLLPGSVSARRDLGAVSYEKYRPEGNKSHSVTCKTIGNKTRTNNKPVSSGVKYAIPSISNISSGLDRVRVLATILYNELTVSAGIGRTLGTSLGTRFGSTGADPLEFAIGGAFKGSGKVINDLTAAGSLADFMVVNEPIGNKTSTDHIVLPFESAQITDSSGQIEYVSGADFFVEAPLRFPDNGGPNTFDEFSTGLNGVTEDVTSYMNELMALDQETPLTPHGIIIRCLTELFKVASFLSEEASSGNVPAITSYSTGILAKSDTVKGGKNYTGSRNLLVDSCFALGMRFREELDLQLEDDYYVPTRCYPEFINPSTTSNINSSVSQTSANSILTSMWSGNYGYGNTKYSSNQTDGQYVSDLITAGDPEDMSVFESFVQISRELQREAMNLAERDGASATYLDNDGFTRYSKFDDNNIIACIYEIMRVLVTEFICIDTKRVTTPGTVYASANRLRVGWDTDKSSKLRDFVEVLVTAAQAGSDLNALFTEDGEALAIEGVASNTALGPNGATAGDLVALLKSAQGHRKFIKYSLSNIRAITQEVSRCNNIVNELFDVMTSDDVNSLDLTEVADETKASLIRISRTPAGRETLKCLTRDQVSLKLVDYYRTDLDEEQPYQTEMNFTTSQSERLAVDIFAASDEITNINRGVVLSVGLPVGMMRNLRKPKFTTSNRERYENVPFTADPDASRIIVTVHREEELYSGITFEPIEFEFDTEIFILPDGIAIEVPDDESAPAQTLSEVVETTTFSRITGGSIVSQDLGLDLIDADPTLSSVLENHVKSYLFSVMMKEIAGLDLGESGFLFFNDLQESVIDSAGYKALRSFAKVESIRKLLGFTPQQVSRAFAKTTILGNREFYKMKNSRALSTLCKPQRRIKLNEYGSRERTVSPPVLNRSTVENLVLQSSCGILGPETRKTRILSPSMFDRIFSVVVSPDQFDIDETGSYQQEVSYRRGADDFDINGYYCEVALGE